MSYSREGVTRAARKGADIKRAAIKAVTEYLQGRSASACMDDLVKAAKEGDAQ